MSESYTDETTLDLKDLLKTVKKRRGLILSIFCIAMILALIISLIMPKVYQAETTLRIKQSKGLGDSLLASMPMGNPMVTKQQMSTYAEIMKSRTVLEAVIRKVYADAPEEKKPKYQDLLKRITTTPVRDTEILQIAVEATDPAEAKLIANTLVDTFIDRVTKLVRSEQEMVRKFIGGRLQQAKKELDKAETTLETYKREQKIAAPDEETKALVERMSGILKLAAENQVELSTAQARLENIKLQISREKVGFIAENQLITQFKGKLAEQEVQLAGLLEQYTESYPEVKALRAAIATTRAGLNSEIARVVNAEASSLNPVHQNLLQGKIQTEAELAAGTAQKTAIDLIIDADERTLATLPAKEQGLTRVMREATLTQEIYVMLAKRYEEAKISEVMQPRDVQVIDRAIALDKPIKPKKALNMMIAAFLGLFAGTGLALALEYINKTVNSADDVRDYLNLPILGTIPDFGGAEKTKTGKWRK
ncbi:MAG: Wzz/FepE/Etk N-terminal domain-containing protein [Bacillota bacterium]